MSESNPNFVYRRKPDPAGPVVYLDEGVFVWARLRLVAMVLAPVVCVLLVWGLWPMDETVAVGPDEDPVLAVPVAEGDGSGGPAVAPGYSILHTSWAGELSSDPDENVEEEPFSLSWNPEAEASENIRKRFTNMDIAIREH